MESVKNCISILQKCRKVKESTCGKELYALICNNGLESHKSVGNYIVPMFIECGSVSNAQQVFNRLVHRNEHSWTSLISGYTQCGQWHHALSLYHKMQEDNVSPNRYTFLALLKACARLKDVEKGRMFHVYIRAKGFEGDAFVCNTLVDMYAKCGSLAEAQVVFDNMPFQDLVSWNALITGYAEYGPSQEALKCFEQMHLEGISANAMTFASILKACGSLKAIVKGIEVHTEIAQKGFEQDLFVGSSLLDMYAKCGALAEAFEVFNKLPVRDVVSWNALISGYADHGTLQETLNCFNEMQLEGILPDVVSWTILIAGYVERGRGQEALTCFQQMQTESISPNPITFVWILKTCNSIGAIDKGREIHAAIMQKGFEKYLYVGNTLVDMYAKCGLLSEAQEVFDKLSVRDVVSWNALIAGYAEYGPGQEALTYIQQMQMDGILMNSVTLVCSLKACGSIGALGTGCQIHLKVAQLGLESDLFIGSSLVDMYAKCGSLSEAKEVFNKLSVHDVVSWNALIGGYAEHGPCKEALRCFAQMQLEGVFPNAVTFICILKACSSTGAIEKGREIHLEVAEFGLARDLIVCNSLIDMYAACGSLSEALEVFDKLPTRDVVSWSSLINGYGMNHEGSRALQCYEGMKVEGVKPNAITFTCLITVCSRNNMAHKGQKYFEVMKEDYGIVPTIDHYNCMVDLLARSGNLFQAEQFLKSIPCLPNAETWKALLSACKTYGEIELGLRCFQQLVQMTPENAASYVLMANIYACAGRRDEARKVEELRKYREAKKKPASALIEVNKEVHEFVVGNKQSNAVSAIIEVLSSEMREEGYMPNVNLVLKLISDEEKEAVLCEHAERLALAFGLLNTRQGQTLRIVKNMRMCNNCHSVNKLVSKIGKREIVVRDSYCIHHFKDGSCSCAVVL